MIITAFNWLDESCRVDKVDRVILTVCNWSDESCRWQDRLVDNALYAQMALGMERSITEAEQKRFIICGPCYCTSFALASA